MNAAISRFILLLFFAPLPLLTTHMKNSFIPMYGTFHARTFCWDTRDWCNVNAHIAGELLEAASKGSLPAPLAFFNKTHELWVGERLVALICFWLALLAASWKCF